MFNVKAIIVVGPRFSAMPEGQNSFPGPVEFNGEFAGVPLAYLDVLGKSVIERVVESLTRSGVADVSLVGPVPSKKLTRFLSRGPYGDVKRFDVPRHEIWQTTDRLIERSPSRRDGTMLLLRLGAYVECDFNELRRFTERGSSCVAVCDVNGEFLDVIACDMAKSQDALNIVRSGEIQSATCRWSFTGYANRLQKTSDMRSLARDGLTGKCKFVPEGVKVKPGVWSSSSARSHDTANLIGPAFLGEGARIEANVVVTRGTSVERGCQISQGTLLENATVLPDTYIGPGLDVRHCVVGFSRVSQIHRNINVEIRDPKITKMLEESPLRSAMIQARETAAKPIQMLRKALRRTTPLVTQEQSPSITAIEGNRANSAGETGTKVKARAMHS